MVWRIHTRLQNTTKGRLAYPAHNLRIYKGLRKKNHNIWPGPYRHNQESWVCKNLQNPEKYGTGQGNGPLHALLPRCLHHPKGLKQAPAWHALLSNVTSSFAKVCAFARLRRTMSAEKNVCVSAGSSADEGVNLPEMRSAIVFGIWWRNQRAPCAPNESPGNGRLERVVVVS